VLNAELDVPAFFTVRVGGASKPPFAALNLASHVGDDPFAVEANRATVSELVAAPISFLSAEHRALVRVVSVPGEQPAPADAVVTRTPGVTLGVLAADCVPLLLHDSSSGAVAAVHVGRESLYHGVVDATVATLMDFHAGGLPAGVLRASLGPSICGGCYEVPQELQARVLTRHPAAASTTRAGKPGLDIAAAVEARLSHLGVSLATRTRVCTMEDQRFYSHRRDGITGRHAGIIECA
jgi:YfiH family protein